VALTAVDRSILQGCLGHEPGSWNDFVDRFVGLLYHVVHYTAHLRSNPVTAEQVEDIAQEILTQIAANDYGLLRQFRGKSSLATYLTVIARRICFIELAKRIGAPRKPLPKDFQPKAVSSHKAPEPEAAAEEEEAPQARAGIESLERVQKLIRRLPGREREVVRLFYLEGRTYEEISIELNLPVKTIGPVLKRARKLLRQYENHPDGAAKQPKADGAAKPPKNSSEEKEKK
jgi:RNA polymerase sigma-70 factor (ECF subfamily)